jgi:hypothetical protein
MAACVCREFCSFLNRFQVDLMLAVCLGWLLYFLVHGSVSLRH